MDSPTPATPPRPRLPWGHHPALQPERPHLCARLPANAIARRSVPKGGILGEMQFRPYEDRFRGRDAPALTRQGLGDGARPPGARARPRVLDGTQHLVFPIEDVPVRSYHGSADNPTGRTPRRQEKEAKRLGLVLGSVAPPEARAASAALWAEADGPVSRLAVETDEMGTVSRGVFLAPRGERGQAECVRPVSLDPPAPPRAGAEAARLRPIGGEGGDGQEPARGTARHHLARAGGGR